MHSETIAQIAAVPLSHFHYKYQFFFYPLPTDFVKLNFDGSVHHNNLVAGDSLFGMIMDFIQKEKKNQISLRWEQQNMQQFLTKPYLLSSFCARIKDIQK